jgi:hypothetical protein
MRFFLSPTVSLTWKNQVSCIVLSLKLSADAEMKHRVTISPAVSDSNLSHGNGSMNRISSMNKIKSSQSLPITFTLATGEDEIIKYKSIVLGNVKKHVNTILTSIIRNLNKVPISLRLLCRILFDKLSEKFPNSDRHEIRQIINTFFFNKWIIPKLKIPFHSGIFEYFDPTPESTNNLELVAKILELIFKEDPNFEECPDLNDFIDHNTMVFEDYFDDLINVDTSTFTEKPNSQNSTKFQSICVSVSDIKKLCYLIQANKETVAKVSSEWAKLVVVNNNITTNFELI